jgi:hypothetical protein
MTELATDPDELDDMIACMAREMGCPHYLSPAYVRPGEVPPEWRGLRTGNGDGPTLYRERQKWRERVIAELERRPDWVREWRAEQDLNRRIEALCVSKGLTFMPHECPPWDAPDSLPEGWRSNGTAGDASLPHAVKLRRRLVAEIEGGR